ncbi:MAG: GDP-mannose 4,6-dehydratase, partial [Bacteroidales bacterium]|nr:GDP-mannose 4,6-dehydratase [Bacteroidales bacterium]
MALAHIGVTIEFKGEGLREQGFVTAVDKAVFEAKVGAEHYAAFAKRIGEAVVAVDPQYFRPTEVELLLGDASKAKQKLGWQPEYDLPALVSEMTDSDLKLMRREEYLRQGGYRIMNYFE